MKKVFITALAAITLAGCATSKPAPIGDQLTWSSHTSKPDWTLMAMPSLEQEAKSDEKTEGVTKFFEFTGLSHRHGSERMAREMAVADATANAVRFAQQLAEKKLQSNIETDTSETKGSNARIQITEAIKIETVGIIENLSVKEIYIEQWASGSETFFKSYALVKIPKEAIAQIRENKREGME